jgi:hypothetical protein
MEINGIAHIQLTVNDMIGGRTAVAITRSSEENRSAAVRSTTHRAAPRLFRARSREDIDEENPQRLPLSRLP